MAKTVSQVAGRAGSLHLEGLKIPKDRAYILVRCSLADEKGDLQQRKRQLAGIDRTERRADSAYAQQRTRFAEGI